MGKKGKKKKHYEAACQGKESFDTPQLAHAVNRRYKGKRNINVYRCWHCGKYHIGGRW